MSERYALYFTPSPGSPLDSFGKAWLGRDPIGGHEIKRPLIDGLSPARLYEISKSARHYGFHGTLKAPFPLARDVTAGDLKTAVAAFAATRTAFKAPPLQLSALGSYLAFTLQAPCPSINKLAADCVRHFERFRAPLSADDIARRIDSGLTPRQLNQLKAFGYPYIFDDFAFHLTLAGPLVAKDRHLVTTSIADKITPLLSRPLLVDGLAIFRQPHRDQPFTQIARPRFQGG